MLGRETEWRQGNLLTEGTAHALGLLEAPGSFSSVVVISHDCDLANDTEEFVEVIVGSRVDEPNRMLTNARNPRRIHLTFSAQGGEGLHIELQHKNRLQISKSEFAKIQFTHSHAVLPADEKRALKQWLAARYGRPAFPNAFETRLRKTLQRKSVEQHIAKILRPESSHLVALFFDLSEDRNVELQEGDAYYLSISVVYDATEGGQLGREAAEKVADQLGILFEKAYGTADTSKEIALEACHAIADTFMSLANLRKVDQWRLEYISLSEDPVGDFFPAGEQAV